MLRLAAGGFDNISLAASGDNAPVTHGKRLDILRLLTRHGQNVAAEIDRRSRLDLGIFFAAGQRQHAQTGQQHGRFK